ncbi:phosphate ABC transporter substrate-binding protein PstS [Pseudonocardia nigra]|uniref:phosphate ABC transporter substrate-binding protein PstS n=1 Tax=Pseudonocardia nigra TaxID=1921578 RepID=UPI001C5FDF05|nr:phosphate ABC transporter substrate-binding protein PstS [Pseudonocardia nigra]
MAAVGVATSGALLLAGCGAANETAAPSTGGADGAAAGVSGSIAGAGSSAQQAAMQAWIAGFTGANPGATVNYDPIGSGGGRTQFIEGATVFAGSDAYLDEEELPAAQERCGGDVVEVPLYISPIAVVYNLEGVEQLNLAPATIAGIFAQQITNWNDPAIAADNPGVTLPDLPITVVNRSDESGTTENFAEYLAAVAPDVWTYEVSGDWPVPGGAAAQGTSGVVGAVGAGNGTIGYADASQAGDLGVAGVGVGGEFVQPTAEAASTVVQASERVEGRGQHSFAFDLARDTTQSGAYPIVLVSYTLACGSYENPADGELVRAFVTYMASEEGQQTAAENAGSAPISDSLRQQFQPAIDAIGAAAS